MLLLAAGIGNHVLNSHREASRVREQQFISLLKLTALGLAGAVQDADTVRAPLAEDIRRVLPEFAFEEGRHFLIIDGEGRVRTIVGEGTPPSSLLRTGQMLPPPLRRLALAANGAPRVAQMALADGSRLLAGAMPLMAWPGAVLLVQPVEALPLLQKKEIGTLALLFAGSFLIVVGIVALYNRQSTHAEKESRQRSDFVRRLETALQLGRCGLWDWDISRGRIYLSPSMRQLLNLPECDGYMDLRDFLGLQHPADAPIDQLLEQELERGSRTFEHELRLRHADNHWMWVKMRGALPENARDGASHLVGIAVDISEQKQASVARRDAERRLTQAIESISESFALWDENMRLIACNSKFREFFGLTEEICRRGRPMDEIMRQAAIPIRKTQAPRVLNDGRGQETTVELELANGRWLQISERSIPGGGYVSVGTDITELKRKQMELERSKRELQQTVAALEQTRREIEHKNVRLKTMARRYQQEKERAEEALRIKSRFLANVSHELFTPLTHIIGFADAMRNQVRGRLSETHLEYAEQIHAAGQEIGHKIRDMLDYAELSTDDAPLKREEVNVAALVTEVDEHFLTLAERKKIRLLRRVPVNLKARVNADLVRKALMQLVSNAVRFTDRGEVVISAEMTGRGEVVLEVRDTGVGIPPEMISQVGQPFERGGHAYKSHAGGSGIGLAIAKAVAEKHGGRLEVESRVGEGTRVRLVLAAAVATGDKGGDGAGNGADGKHDDAGPGRDAGEEDGEEPEDEMPDVTVARAPAAE